MRGRGPPRPALGGMPQELGSVRDLFGRRRLFPGSTPRALCWMQELDLDACSGKSMSCIKRRSNYIWIQLFVGGDVPWPWLPMNRTFGCTPSMEHVQLRTTINNMRGRGPPRPALGGMPQEVL